MMEYTLRHGIKASELKRMPHSYPSRGSDIRYRL